MSGRKISVTVNNSMYHYWSVAKGFTAELRGLSGYLFWTSFIWSISDYILHSSSTTYMTTSTTNNNNHNEKNDTYSNDNGNDDRFICSVTGLFLDLNA